MATNAPAADAAIARMDATLTALGAKVDDITSKVTALEEACQDLRGNIQKEVAPIQVVQELDAKVQSVKESLAALQKDRNRAPPEAGIDPKKLNYVKDTLVMPSFTGTGFRAWLESVADKMDSHIGALAAAIRTAEHMGTPISPSELTKWAVTTEVDQVLGGIIARSFEGDARVSLRGIKKEHPQVPALELVRLLVKELSLIHI